MVILETLLIAQLPEISPSLLAFLVIFLSSTRHMSRGATVQATANSLRVLYNSFFTYRLIIRLFAFRDTDKHTLIMLTINK